MTRAPLAVPRAAGGADDRQNEYPDVEKEMRTNGAGICYNWKRQPKTNAGDAVNINRRSDRHLTGEGARLL